MTNILFIVPPHITFDKFINPGFNERAMQKKTGKYGSLLTDMPLGVLSLSAYIKKYTDVKVKLIDFNILLNKLESFTYKSFQELFEETLSSPEYINFQPDIIGISALFSPSYQSLLDTGVTCRNIFPNSLITAGGGIPTNMSSEILTSCDCFDALFYGEGEKPLLGLITAKDKQEYIKNNNSLITLEKIKNGVKFHHDFIQDLDEIPFYDYSILDTEQYGLNPAITAYASIDEKQQNFHVMTSRGCTHKCCFCSSHTVHGRTMRYYSIDRVKQDFKRLRDEYGAKTIIFQDDHLMADIPRAFKIIEIIKDLKLKVVFQNGLSLYALDRKMLEAIKSAGVNQLLLSVESGSERVLKDIMHKPLSLSIVNRVANDCKELGIYTNVNILIGLPGETKQDIEDARAFLKTINANWFLTFCATPLVGSEMFEICEKNNYFKDNHIGCDYKNAVIETEHFTAEYIQNKAYSLNLELNFVYNSDYRLGNYEMALKGFNNAIRAKSDHALAYYFAAKCYKKMSLISKYQDYKTKYNEIINSSQFWKKYAEEFNLKELD